MLEDGSVDGVICMVPDADDPWKPVPAIITEAADMAQARGMRMGYAPLLAMLEPAAEMGLKRLAMIGIPCQVYALRRIEEQLGFEAITVIGTPCSDNTTTANFHDFLARLSDKPETITYLEFRADYHVELRFEDGRSQTIPFLQLPLSDLSPDFFPLTCRTCVDYTNTLADITVGYMGGTGEQWVIVRNDRGARALEASAQRSNFQPPPIRANAPVRWPVFATILRARRAGFPCAKCPIGCARLWAGSCRASDRAASNLPARGLR
jgi:coenzyme F420 hydrogenase subunit beta